MIALMPSSSAITLSTLPLVALIRPLQASSVPAALPNQTTQNSLSGVSRDSEMRRFSRARSQRVLIRFQGRSLSSSTAPFFFFCFGPVSGPCGFADGSIGSSIESDMSTT